MALQLRPKFTILLNQGLVHRFYSSSSSYNRGEERKDHQPPPSSETKSSLSSYFTDIKASRTQTSTPSLRRFCRQSPTKEDLPSSGFGRIHDPSVNSGKDASRSTTEWLKQLRNGLGGPDMKNSGVVLDSKEFKDSLSVRTPSVVIGGSESVGTDVADGDDGAGTIFDNLKKNLLQLASEDRSKTTAKGGYSGEYRRN